MKIIAPVLCLLAGLLLSSCLRKPVEEVLKGEFRDDFSRGEPGESWRKTGGSYSIEEGALRLQGCRNHTLWLKRKLPPNLEMTFTAWSDSPDGDIKFELFGDGFSTSTGEGAYTATGYVFVFGGWKNTLSIIARMDEHGSDRKTTKRIKVEPGKRYRMKVKSEGSKLTWWVDDQVFLTYDDPSPLRGSGHDHFGFNNWDAPVSFDDLVIRAR